MPWLANVGLSSTRVGEAAPLLRNCFLLRLPQLVEPPRWSNLHRVGFKLYSRSGHPRSAR
jgi:hypothetical protein